MFHIRIAWIWIKENWKLPLLVVWTIFVWAFSRKNADAAIEVLAAKKESYDKQIISLKENHNKELSKRDKLLKQYHDTISRLEKEYEERSLILSKKEKDKVKQIVQETNGEPDAVREKIEKLFNLPELD
jgi:type VI protein secretion system component VasK